MSNNESFNSLLIGFLPVLLIALPILLIVYIPRPPVSGSQFIIFPVIAFVSAIIILGPKNIQANVFDLKKAGLVMFILVFQALFVCLSQFVNIDSIRSTGIVTIFKPILQLMILVLGIMIASKVNKRNLYRGLYFAGVFIILGQIIISIPQVFEIPLFDLIYSTEKARGLGGTFRVTGSIYNPNIFALILTQASILVILFGKKKIKFVWFALAFFMIIASGSRSVLLLFPIAIFLSTLFSKNEINSKRIFHSILIALFGAAVLVAIIYFFSDTFLYLAQLLVLFDVTNITTIRSVSLRLDWWATQWNLFNLDSSMYKWFIGLGSREYFQVADNDYLYTLWHYGLIGLGIHILVYISLFSRSIKSFDQNLKSLGITCLVLLLILGLQVETMGGWLQPLTTFYFIGLAIGCSKNNFTFYSRKNLSSISGI